MALDDSCALPSTASQDQYDSSALTCRSNSRGSRESVLSDIVDQEHATVVAELRGGAMWEFSVQVVGAGAEIRSRRPIAGCSSPSRSGDGKTYVDLDEAKQVLDWREE